MIDVRQAVGAAMDYVNSFSELLPTANVRLEETELREDDDGMPIWAITLSFTDNPLVGSRSNKLFIIDADTSQIRSMKARNLLGNK